MSLRPHRWRHWTMTLTVSMALSLPPLLSTAQPAPDAPKEAPGASQAESTKKEEARQHFEKGLSLYDASAWDAALAEFQLSNQLRPSYVATKNAAICLGQLKRYDEKLEMLEQLTALADLPLEARTWADREIAAVRGLVGSLVLDITEPGATIAIDGRTRGTSPVREPLRVSAGSRIVRVYKMGFAPAEVLVDVAGGQSLPVKIQLIPLVESGWLQVKEVTGETLDVVVDNAVVGKTPWRGLVAPGEHTVLLRGERQRGTQPTSAEVRLNQVTELSLLAENVSSTLSIVPTPTNATLTLDGVRVGRGTWNGGLRPGLHRIRVAADGYEPQVQEVTLQPDASRTLSLTLAPIEGPPAWWVQRRLVVEASVFYGLLPSFGGDLSRGCSGDCSAPVGSAFAAVGRIGYRFPFGLLAAIEAGYWTSQQTIHSRDTAAIPTGLAGHPGKPDDVLTLRGALVGVSPGFQLGDRVPLTFGLGLGVFIGTLEDHRAGDFTASSGIRYAVDVTERLSVEGLYAAPEVRLGVWLSDRVQVSGGVRTLVLVVPSPPVWVPNEGYFKAGPDGQAHFAEETLVGTAMVAVTPGLSARVEF